MQQLTGDSAAEIEEDRRQCAVIEQQGVCTVLDTVRDGGVWIESVGRVRFEFEVWDRSGLD